MLKLRFCFVSKFLSVYCLIVRFTLLLFLSSFLFPFSVSFHDNCDFCPKWKQCTIHEYAIFSTTFNRKYSIFQQNKNWIQSFGIAKVHVVYRHALLSTPLQLYKTTRIAFNSCNYSSTLLNTIAIIIICYNITHLLLSCVVLAFNDFENSSRRWAAWFNGCVLHWLIKFQFRSHVSTLWSFT